MKNCDYQKKAIEKKAKKEDENFDEVENRSTKELLEKKNKKQKGRREEV
jgi:hypothetical protein